MLVRSDDFYMDHTHAFQRYKTIAVQHIFSPFCISGITTSDCTEIRFTMRECNALEARFWHPGVFIFPLKKQDKNLLCHNIFFVKSVTLVYVHTLCVFLDRISCFGYLRRADIFPIISTFQPKSSRLNRPLSRETINYTRGPSFEEKTVAAQPLFP